MKQRRTGFGNMDEVEIRKMDNWEVDSDFYQMKDNVYLALYDENAYFYMKRKAAVGIYRAIDFSNGGRYKSQRWEARVVYVYDLKLQMKNTVYSIRGLRPVTDAEESFLIYNSDCSEFCFR